MGLMSALNVVGIIQIHILVLKIGVHTRKYVEPLKDMSSLIPKRPNIILVCRKKIAWMMNRKLQVQDLMRKLGIYLKRMCLRMLPVSFRAALYLIPHQQIALQRVVKIRCNSSSTGCLMKISQESFEVPTVEVIETYDVLRSVEVASDNQQAGESCTEQHSETLIESSKLIGGGGAISTVGLETECKGILHESEAMLASALGKREDTLDSSWNDEVIYSDVEGPHGFALEATSMIYPGEVDYIVSENVMVDTSPVKANAAQVIFEWSQSVPDDIPFADVSLNGGKGLEEFESNHSPNPCLPETLKGDECETQPEGLSISKEVLLEDKTEPQGQTALVAINEFPSAENKMISKIDSQGIEMKAEEGESSFGAVESETLRLSLPVVDPKVAYSKSGVAEEVKSPNSKLSSEAENYVSPVSEGDDESYQRKRSTETSKEESSDKVCRESSKGGLVEESSYVNVTNPKDDHISHSGSALDDTVGTAYQRLLESRTEFHRVVGGLGVIQGNEIDGAHKFYAEVPVTLESNDRRDFGRLQNLSEAQIRSLVSSPLVNRNNTSHVFETVSGVSGGADKSENASESSSSLAVALSKNQEITMEKTTSWSTVKEQHIPLKNLLSEARSPKLPLQANDHESKIPRVSSILDQETSPEDARREVSEEWNSPAKYPVDLKREERKTKGRPFWVPFVCCSSVN